MARVTVVNWNPRRSPMRRFGGRFLDPISPRSNNFGDLLGPIVVSRMLASRGIAADAAITDARLLAIGSIMQFAETGDHVWGTGVNGKVPAELHTFAHLDVRAVRGPRTRDFLLSRGIPVPEVYGDPALLLPDLDPRLRLWATDKRFDVTIVPNFRDASAYRRDPRAIDPTRPVDRVLERIARSRTVVGSSLHGIIIAEALGIPARMIEPSAATYKEDSFKYADYYLGTGRPSFSPSLTAEEAMARGGEPPLEWSPDPLRAAFPWDLWSA